MADDSLRSRSARVSHAGFTLIELLVVVAIIVVISAVILIDNNKFGGQVILENLAYDVALSVRQAQVYGIAVKGFNYTNFQAGYGMHFSTATALDQTKYNLFADLNHDGIYHASLNEDASSSPFSIHQGYSISSMCAIQALKGTSCLPVTEIDILYERPEPNAFISAANGGTPVSCLNNINACYYE